MQGFVWPEGFRERVDAHRRSGAALRDGRDLVEEGIYRFRAFEPVAIDLFADWEADPVRNRGWQWHAASFNFMPWLLALHGQTGDQRAIDHAGEAIASWYRQFVIADSDYEFAWHDHATANRLTAVLSLLCHLDEHPARFQQDALLPGFLAAHGDRLCQEEMYSRYSNHGIDQSRALLLLATCAPWLEGAERWRKVALERLEDELGHAFAADGGHVENSPGYHQFASNLFSDVLHTFGDALQPSFRDRVRDTLAGAARFMAWIVRPDGRLPPIGDTECRQAANVYGPLAGTTEHAHVQWVCSRGAAGEKPAGWAKPFPDSGYFIARSDWASGDLPGDAWHLVFRCGHQSDFHRHDDDLSLSLWWGSDWFVDGGAYGYVEDHPVRRYLRSKWAHNVVVIDDGDGETTWERPGEAAPGDMAMVGSDPGYPVARGATQSYPGMRATRDVSVSRDDARFEVFDSLVPDAGVGRRRKFLSLWHIPADKTVSIEGQSVTITDATLMRDIVIHNLGVDFDDIRVSGSLPDGGEVVCSRLLNRTDRCRMLVLERSCETFESRLEFRLHDRRPEHRVAGRGSMRPRALLRSYAVDSMRWWPPQAAHHARRVIRRVDKATEGGLSVDGLVEELCAWAVVRQRHRKPTLYLSNMGYPDASLVESRLGASMGMLRAGEVYLPGPMQKMLMDWPDEERLLFVDAIHLLHAGIHRGGQMFNTVVNSSQGQIREAFLRGSIDAVRVLVTRDPVDAALNAMARLRPADGWNSRAEAEAELTRQVGRLERFLRWALPQKFALTFRIEEFALDPRPVLDRIGTLCHSKPDVSLLSTIPEIDAMAASQDDMAIEAIHGLPARAMLGERLSEMRGALGYA